jgi:hypothetical protein
VDQVIKLTFVALVSVVAATSVAAARRPAPLYDPVALNIGLNCKWQRRCMARQHQAMSRATDFVRKQRPAAWRIHLCNRNAARGRSRVDWIGFDNCIRNATLRPPPQRQLNKRRLKIFRR